ncbi:hypothetical protein ACWEPC_01040 [Nonomuraea sp. NPDC004297]
MHRLERDDKNGDGHEHQPAALVPFGHQLHDQRHGRQQRSQPVQGGMPVPASAALQAPVPDHADLGEGEADEHADGEDRHQRLGVPLGHQEQDQREDGEHRDAVTVDLPVGAQGPLSENRTRI